MEHRTLGRQGLRVSALGLGCMGLLTPYGAPEAAESVATIHRAIDLGVDMFDTAEMYGPFDNEELLGHALKGVRHKVKLATKFGYKLQGRERVGVDSRPEHVKQVCDAALKRLQTDVIDLFYQHRLDRTVPIEDTVGAMADLVAAGKVRYLGLCEVGVNAIRRAHAVHPITALQAEFSLWERNLEADVLPCLRELGIGLVPYSPMGRGFLTGVTTRAENFAQSDFRRHDPRLAAGNYDRSLAIIETVRAVAAKYTATPAQVVLAWALAQGPDVVPIPGTKQRKYLEENLKALDLKLAPADVAALSAAVPPGVTAGPRYSAVAMASIDR